MEKWDMRIKNDPMIADKNFRRKVILEFLDVLKDTHEKNLWTMFTSDERDEVVKFFDLFDKEEFSIESISVNYLQMVGDRYKLLFDDNNVRKIAEVMITDKYFYNLMNE